MDAAAFKLTLAEVERLAEMEHERWCAERTREGWRYGPPSPSDKARKTHPDLVAWAALPEGERAKNRVAVRELPRFLARAGFQIDRLAPAAS